MVDNNLNPWLIEVNHLPSFGTDSPLDKDIKDRLMRQVFSVLPVMADDQAAYTAFHKAESEKRLIAHKLAKEQELKALKEKPKIFPRPKRDTSVDRPGLSGARSGPANGGPGIAGQGSEKSDATSNNNNDSGAEDLQGLSNDEQGVEGSNQDDQSLVNAVEDYSNYENQETSQSAAGGEGNTMTNSDGADLGDEDLMDLMDEECTPERIQEIKQILIDIYEKKSPEKINKIDRLLQKYAGHEEEFLLFVFSKYGISPLEYEFSKPRAIREALAARAARAAAAGRAAAATSSGSKDDSARESDGMRSPDTIATETAKKAAGSHSSSNNNSNNNHRQDPKRYSRSVSPPRSTGPRRIAPAWKSAAPEEDAALK